MTICIAALCTDAGQPMIVGAADQMVSAGDIEFEPPQPKIWGLSDHSVAMLSGSSTDQFAILRRAQGIVAERKLTKVGEIAAVYAQEFADYRREAAAAAVLSPLGLDTQSFLDRQNSLDQQLVRTLSSQLQNEKINGRVIVTGMDDSGGHIYEIRDPGRTVVYDSIGFAAIGGGQWHAESQFMFAGHTAKAGFQETLFLAYTAKKRAEVAPGVGSATDMFVIGFNPRTLFAIYSPVMNDIEKIYQRFDKRATTNRNRANAEIKAYLVKKAQEAKTESALPTEAPKVATAQSTPVSDGRTNPTGG